MHAGREGGRDMYMYCTHLHVYIQTYKHKLKSMEQKFTTGLSQSL